METKVAVNTHFLHPGGLFADNSEYVVTTILGSCVSVCLWDERMKIGGINHYMLALWNGEGLASPRYGSVAIPKLIEKVLQLGCKKHNLKAKIFGGATLIGSSSGILNVGQRNVMLADDLLSDEKIPIVARSVEGDMGLKLIYNTKTGSVLIKKIQKKILANK